MNISGKGIELIDAVWYARDLSKACAEPAGDAWEWVSFFVEGDDDEYHATRKSSWSVDRSKAEIVRLNRWSASGSQVGGRGHETPEGVIAEALEDVPAELTPASVAARIVGYMAGDLCRMFEGCDDLESRLVDRPRDAREIVRLLYQEAGFSTRTLDRIDPALLAAPEAPAGLKAGFDRGRRHGDEDETEDD